jgi:hypothetical protein
MRVRALAAGFRSYRDTCRATWTASFVPLSLTQLITVA